MAVAESGDDRFSGEEGSSVMRWMFWVASVFAVALLWVNQSAAEPSASGQQGPKATGVVECPPLTQTKYPFLTCVKAEFGTGSVLYGEPELLPAREMPALDPYVERAENSRRGIQ